MGQDPLTFLVTGVSAGLGRAFAEAAVSAGHVVVGTVRTDADGRSFEALAPGRALARHLDVTDDNAVVALVADVEATVGPIDVAIVNAGYSHEGIVEESPLAQLRAQFDVNVLGATATIKAVLPYMRRRRAGHILGVTSMGGLMTVPGLAYYCASKYALEAILETVGKEVQAFGVHVTAVAPGAFRTDWTSRMVETERTIEDYDTLMTAVRDSRIAAAGRQPGDPARAAQALLSVIDSPNPPAHLVLGSDALQLVTSGRAAVDADITAWAELSRSTDFPVDPAAT
ncbi:short-chain dehydrogenase/reductase [Mycolicibacterium fortuitum]|uniref:oxidoreductase n=1 Tax=Mycolicibacterium fortuitum TaxID=1766 RepID=UPI0007ED67A6|nr:oxidoreductase [Mycolicibacterium fortuitum]OBI73196.1 short-chain dehydrogenase/reductase [Mycolicibacterium fortuitum]